MKKLAASKIIRSKRRTIALSIAADASIVVRAPLRTPLSFIEEFIAKHAVWIKRRMAEVLSRAQKSPRLFVNGEEFLFLGHPLRLEISDGQQIVLYDKLLFPERLLPNAREELKNWYKQQARDLIAKRAQALAAQMNVRYSRIKIGSAARRWGSCSISGDLNFTWRLIMAPVEVLDCVIVHELTHLTEKNHSLRFWSRVAEISPNYKELHQWLKTNEHLLHI